jgi:hypothetical protein
MYLEGIGEALWVARRRAEEGGWHAEGLAAEMTSGL